MKTEVLKEYARVIVKIGVNVQEGQDVYISTSTNNVEIAEYVVEECYKAKARKVKLDLKSPTVERLRLLNESVDTLSELTEEQKGFYEDSLKHPPVKIWIDDDDPDQFAGIPMEKLTEPRKRKYPLIKKYIDELDGKAQWTIVAMPSLAWAKKMYPNETSDACAIEKLEQAIMKTMRISEGKADENWQKHISYLESQAKKMNDYHFKSLHYTSSNGTDFTVGLHPNHQWCTAWEKQKNGVSSCVNMPTEEVFTLPQIDSANGIVYATKPLSYNGNLIEDFSVTFKDGKAIKVQAKKGQEHLEEMIQMDEASAYLGEVALVPYDSPINQIGVLFYNTLFDENASCHLALGDGISEALVGYETMSTEELKVAGVNDSMIHVDFMVGAIDTKIVGMREDGSEVVVFNNGMWAI